MKKSLGGWGRWRAGLGSCQDAYAHDQGSRVWSNASWIFGGMMEEIGVTEVMLVESVDEETLPEFALMVDIPD